MELIAWAVLAVCTVSLFAGLSAVHRSAHRRYQKAHKADNVPDIQQLGWHWPFLSVLAIAFQVVLVYWAWVCIEYHQGVMVRPSSWTADGLAEFARDTLWAPVADKAWPSQRAWLIWLSWVAMQGVLFVGAPGPVGEGALLPDGKTRLKYKYNGQFAFFATIPVFVAMHLLGTFRLTELYDLYPQLISVCVIYTAAMCLCLELYTVFNGGGSRPTNSLWYNYFMGTLLNPRPFGFDLKFFHEIRVGIPFWFAMTVALALKMYDVYGVVSTPMLLVVMGHLFFVNACFKGEDCIPHSYDIIYENFGFMLLGLDVIMVPFVFPLQAYYLLKMGPYEHSPLYTAFVAFLIIFGYWLFDSSNAQKDYFRADQQGVKKVSKGFPQLPWSHLKGLTSKDWIETSKGTKLLVAGWWKWGRHLNYTGDLLQGLGWSLACGVGSFIPWVYIACYLGPLLLHREYRDDLRCSEKYGKDWAEYKRRVPYRLIPYVY